MDRLGRLASHLFSQRNFYPLVPPAEEMSIDMDLFTKHGILSYIPHMLILPSDFKQFIKVKSFSIDEEYLRSDIA